MGKKRRINRTFFWGTTIIALLAVIILLMPSYLKKAIIYGHSGIYDYKIFYNRQVQTGKSTPYPDAKNYNSTIPQKHFTDSIELLGTTEYLIVKNDSILYEYLSPDKANSEISNSFSVAKSIIGLLIGCAIQDGYLESVNDSIDQILPELVNLKNKGLTISHLLTMSSGSDWDEQYSSAFSITTKAYYGKNIDKLMASVKVVNEPGKIFKYKSGDTQLLAMILVRVTGKSISQYASEKLWQPLGAEKNALWSLDKEDGMEKAYCCFNSNARDFAKLGSLLLKSGEWNGKQILPKDYLFESITPANYLLNEKNKPLSYFGYHWWILNYRGFTIPYARGLHGQYIFVLPHNNSVIVRLGHFRSDQKINDHPLDVYTWINMGLSLIENF